MSERGLFEPDVLITEHFAAARRRGAAFSSEKRLMLAVLRNALDDYQKYIVATDRIGRQLFAGAAEWIACTSNEDSFSFENISETLDINPDYLRRGLAAWHKRLLEAHCRSVELPTPESLQLVRAAI
jgi:hypothetical protein